MYSLISYSTVEVACAQIPLLNTVEYPFSTSINGLLSCVLSSAIVPQPTCALLYGISVKYRTCSSVFPRSINIFSKALPCPKSTKKSVAAMVIKKHQ